MEFWGVLHRAETFMKMRKISIQMDCSLLDEVHFGA